jgi:predicted peptidase
VGRWLVGLAVVVAVALGSAGAAAPRATHVSVDRALYSPAVAGRLRLAVYLPSDYGTSGKRYPVVYFLHGLPASSTAYQGSSFLADALDRTGRRAIIVAPQGARDNDTDPEYLDWGPGRNWETAIIGTSSATSTRTSARSQADRAVRSSGCPRAGTERSCSRFITWSRSR